MTKKIISTLALAFAITSPVLNINTQAQVNDYEFRIVTSPIGLNVRDSNCNIVDVVGYGTNLGKLSDKTINCNINGENIKMINYSTIGVKEGYVAEIFTDPVQYKHFDYSIFNPDQPDATTPIFIVNTPLGLNLRDDQCNKVTTLNYLNKVVLMAQTVSYIICNAGGVYYYMMPVIYNSQPYYIASIYLDQVN